MSLAVFVSLEDFSAEMPRWTRSAAPRKVTASRRHDGDAGNSVQTDQGRAVEAVRFGAAERSNDPRGRCQMASAQRGGGGDGRKRRASTLQWWGGPSWDPLLRFFLKRYPKRTTAGLFSTLNYLFIPRSLRE